MFREHFLTCFISDKVGVKLRNMIGIDNICWEADYPHSDSMWPGAPEELWEVLSENSVPDDEIKKMSYENAMRWYSFDPFSHITPKQQATWVRCAKPLRDTMFRSARSANTTTRGRAQSFADFAASAKEPDRQQGLTPTARPRRCCIEQSTSDDEEMSQCPAVG